MPNKYVNRTPGRRCSLRGGIFAGAGYDCVSHHYMPMKNEDKRTKYTVPAKGTGDHVHHATKVAISTIPLVGGQLSETFAYVVAPPLEQKQEKWMKEVSEGLIALESGAVERPDNTSLPVTPTHLYGVFAKTKNGGAICLSWVRPEKSDAIKIYRSRQQVINPSDRGTYEETFFCQSIGLSAGVHQETGIYYFAASNVFENQESVLSPSIAVDTSIEVENACGVSPQLTPKNLTLKFIPERSAILAFWENTTGVALGYELRLFSVRSVQVGGSFELFPIDRMVLGTREVAPKNVQVTVPLPTKGLHSLYLLEVRPLYMSNPGYPIYASIHPAGD